MAVPKKRTGHSAQGHRRSNWKATKPETTKCPNCGAAVLTHTVCTACGTYKGQPVSLKDKAKAPAVIETKKRVVTKTAKTSKKAEAAAEEVKAEEVKEETKKPAKKAKAEKEEKTDK
jgi:large subunit ribosomal protein L32